MPNEEHFGVVLSGADEIAKWREASPDTQLSCEGADFSGADLRNSDLGEANFHLANLLRANLRGVNLSGANLSEANISEANLCDANLSGADLRAAALTGAQLTKADLSGANLHRAKLFKANLAGSNLTHANLTGADLYGVDLSGASLSGAKFNDADLTDATLAGADLRRASFNGAELSNTNLSGVNLIHATLSKARLTNANLSGAKLTKANLSEASLIQTNLAKAKLRGTNLSKAIFARSDLRKADFTGVGLAGSFFDEVDLSMTNGLADVYHSHPSAMSHSTLQKSKGRIHCDFLRGCGLQDWEIELARLYDPVISEEEAAEAENRAFQLRFTQGIQFSSLFISYSHKNADFLELFEPKLISRGIRFWRDVHDATAGPLDAMVGRAMRTNPTVLLILSEASVMSAWVKAEIRSAMDLGEKLGRHVLCPIALDATWKEKGLSMPLRAVVMEYNVLDFSEWKDEDVFDRQFKKLVDGMQLFYPAPRA